MIGSSTLIVKSESKYDLHVFGSGLGMYMLTEDCKRQGISPFSKMRHTVEKWGEADKSNLTEEEVIQVADASHCRKDHMATPGYSEFAGDGVYLLDLDSNSFYSRDREKKLWVKL
jgi:hypothetical protein